MCVMQKKKSFYYIFNQRGIDKNIFNSFDKTIKYQTFNLKSIGRCSHTLGTNRDMCCCVRRDRDEQQQN